MQDTPWKEVERGKRGLFCCRPFEKWRQQLQGLNRAGRAQCAKKLTLDCSVLSDVSNKEFNFTRAIQDVKDHETNITFDSDSVKVRYEDFLTICSSHILLPYQHTHIISQEHFSKLKFNYVELETKKIFLDELGNVDRDSWTEISPVCKYFWHYVDIFKLITAHR